MPARVGEEELTAWKRWGILTTREVKGKPAKKALLFIFSYKPQDTFNLVNLQ